MPLLKTLTLLFLAILVGCKGSSAPSAAEQELPKVTTVQVAERETTDVDEYTGSTQPSQAVEVRSQVYGVLKTVKFTDGADVAAGDELYIIDPEEYQAIHNQSLARINLHDAQLEVNKAKLARRAQLVKSGAVSKEEYEEAIADVKSSEASIEAAKADASRTYIDLKNCVVKAPISGRIDKNYVSAGNIVTGGQGSGTLLTKIVNEQPMWVNFDVDERSTLKYMRQRKDITQLPGNLTALDLKCFLKLADEKEFSHEGTLEVVANEADKKTGTTKIRATFPNKRKMLAGGMFVRLRIPVSKPYQALMIPESAIGSNLSIKFVYVVGSDGTAERRTVTLGKQEGTLRVIKDGLKAGEQVITKGLQRVRPGQKVEAKLEKLEAPAPVTIQVNEPVEEKPMQPKPTTGEKPAIANPEAANPGTQPPPADPAKTLNPVPGTPSEAGQR